MRFRKGLGVFFSLILSTFLITSAANAGFRVRLEKDVIADEIIGEPDNITFKVFVSGTADTPVASQTFFQGNWSAESVTKVFPEKKMVRFIVDFTNTDALTGDMGIWMEIELDGTVYGAREKVNQETWALFSEEASFSGTQSVVADEVLSEHIDEADGTTGQNTNAGSGIKTGHIQKGAVSTPKIKSGAITTQKIASGAVNTAKIRRSAVNSLKIMDGGVENVDIADNAVTGSKIADGSVTAADLATNSVFAAEIATGAVASAEILDGSVTYKDLGKDSVQAEEIAAGAVGTSEVLDNSLTAADLATSSVGSLEIATSAVGTSEVADNSLTSADLAPCSVASSEVCDNSLTTIDLAPCSVAGSEVCDNSLTSLDLAANSVGVSEIAANAVGSSEVIDNSLTALDLASAFYAGVDADLLDGQHGYAYLRSNASDYFTVGTLYINSGTTLDVNGTLRMDGSVSISDGKTIVVAGNPADLIIDGTNLNLQLGGSSADDTVVTGDLTVNYTTTTRTLVITGGADLSEQFHVRGLIKDFTPSAGMVVSIDPKNPGDLVVSNKNYDRAVAGIISGAGGVKTGMMMSQKGTVADGNSPVALTGRVYCWADASNGSIVPGDLLTTSISPGHAMKVTDYTKAQGAIIGKAMTSLESGKGLVLVLVNLQ